MGRRSVGAEIRRVVARLGGDPRVRTLDPVEVAVHRAEVPRPDTAALAPGVEAVVRAPAAPGAGAAALRVPPPGTGAHPAALRLTATAGRGDGVVAPPVARTVPAAVAARARAVTASVTPPATTEVGPLRPRPRRGPPLLGRVAARAVPRLPRRVTARAGRRGAPALLVLRRTRASWESISRERLAANWARLRDEHRLPADELRLVGVYGPLPLGLVDAIALEEDGRLRVSLRRRATPGPLGDLAVARHEPSGRLLRSACPARGGGGRGVF